jgi:hypothetical protein
MSGKFSVFMLVAALLSSHNKLVKVVTAAKERPPAWPRVLLSHLTRRNIFAQSRWLIAPIFWVRRRNRQEEAVGPVLARIDGHFQRAPEEQLFRPADQVPPDQREKWAQAASSRRYEFPPAWSDLLKGIWYIAIL